MTDPGIRTETAPPAFGLERLTRARTVRRVIIGLLVAFLIAAASGAFGVRTRTVRSVAGEYELSVEYAAVTRPGLATPWGVEVRRAGGFDGTVTVAASSAYLDMFDENGLDPDPSAATADAEFVEWEFDPPRGDVLAVSFDARIEPARQWGTAGIVKLLQDGRTITQVRFRTWVMP